MPPHGSIHRSVRLNHSIGGVISITVSGHIFFVAISIYQIGGSLFWVMVMALGRANHTQRCYITAIITITIL